MKEEGNKREEQSRSKNNLIKMRHFQFVFEELINSETLETLRLKSAIQSIMRCLDHFCNKLDLYFLKPL